MISFILLLLIVLFIIFFTVQNSIPVTISFLVWQFEASLAIVIFLSVISGIIIAIFFYLWRKIKTKKIKKEKNQE